MVERLERRTLMSVALSSEGILQIKGTDGADVYSLVESGDSLTVTENGVTSTYLRSDVKGIELDAGAGADLVRCQTQMRVELFGGRGRDTLIGGMGDDVIYGGMGSDQIDGRGGNDTLNSGDGRDTIFGGAGDDQIAAEGGTTVYGRGGDDLITDNNGNNVIVGGAGADAVIGYTGTSLVRTVEGYSYGRPTGTADPFVFVSALRYSDGTIAVVVTATHFTGGFARHFGDMQQTGNVFEAQVWGTDLGGTGGVTDALVTESHTYTLGKLQPGKYTFSAEHDGVKLAQIRIGVTSSGLSTWTVTMRSPYAPELPLVDSPVIVY